jgi:hypothetical protein
MLDGQGIALAGNTKEHDMTEEISSGRVVVARCALLSSPEAQRQYCCLPRSLMLDEELTELLFTEELTELVFVVFFSFFLFFLGLEILSLVGGVG